MSLFDFSQVKKGDLLTRVFAGKAEAARVIYTNDAEITCVLHQDGDTRTITYSRVTGVDLLSPGLGMIVNIEPRVEDSNFLQDLRKQLQAHTRGKISYILRMAIQEALKKDETVNHGQKS